MNDAVYQKFVSRWEEVMDLPPQRLGPLTPYYKRMVPYLKVMPLPLLVLGSLFLVFVLYVLAGSAITFLVTLLQRGI